MARGKGRTAEGPDQAAPLLGDSSSSNSLDGDYAAPTDERLAQSELLDPVSPSTAHHSMADVSTQTMAPSVSTCTAVFILAAFSLHNGWNCFVFLDFNDYGPVHQLLNITDAQIGFINSK